MFVVMDFRRVTPIVAGSYEFGFVGTLCSYFGGIGLARAVASGVCSGRDSPVRCFDVSLTCLGVLLALFLSV